MDRELGRRALIAALVAGGIGGLTHPTAAGALKQFAPLSGSVWESARATPRDTVESPHGEAEVRIDDAGVPAVTASDERALSFAVGYVQATDRLFQMDLQRRLFRGELSAVVGDATVDSDRFHRQMAFAEAAEATADHLDGTPVASVVDAFADGVNRAIETEALPVEFHLLEYEPDPWRRADTTLIEKLIAWQLTGDFGTLRRNLVRDRVGQVRPDAPLEELFPSRIDHDAPIIRDHHEAGDFVIGDRPPETRSRRHRGQSLGKPLVDRLSRFTAPSGIGSNSWVIGPEHTAGEAPILANDPHLSLQAPPTWYEMHLSAPAYRARGVTLPGAPIVVIGENDHGAWGFTNAGADVIDFYRYDHDGETYAYGDDRRSFDVETQEIEVAGASSVSTEVVKSVHGPVVEEEGETVGVAWTGHTATRTLVSLYRLNHSTGVDDVREAARDFDIPTQNLVYADRDGNTLYQLTGRIPIRTIDGTPVDGDRIFDGSAREGEWVGFEPFGESSWDGFVPFEAKPHVVNPDYLATANQQIVDDERLDYYLSSGYANPFRAERIYERLDERIGADEPVDLEFLRALGRDTFDGRTVLVEPLVAAAEASEDDRLLAAAATLSAWDGHMDADSEAALLFDRWFERYRHELVADTFETAGLDESYYPRDAAIVHVPADSPWFGDGGRPAAMRRALERAIDAQDEEEHTTYGAVNHTGHIAHPLQLEFLGYPRHPRGGTAETVWNYSRAGPWGGSWEMQVDLDGELLGILPGGNSGDYFSANYTDQLEAWADGEYRTLTREPEGRLAITFVGVDE